MLYLVNYVSLYQHITDTLLAETTSDCLIIKEMKEIIADDMKSRYINSSILPVDTASSEDENSFADDDFSTTIIY